MLPPYDRIVAPNLLQQFEIDRLNADGSKYTTSIIAHSWEPVDDWADALSFNLLVLRNDDKGEEFVFQKSVLLIRNWYEVRNVEITVVN